MKKTNISYLIWWLLCIVGGLVFSFFYPKYAAICTIIFLAFAACGFVNQRIPPPPEGRDHLGGLIQLAIVTLALLLIFVIT